MLLKYLKNILTPLIQEEIKNNMFEVKQQMMKIYSYHGDINKLSISENAVVNNALFNLASGKIIIEDYAFFGHNVCLLTGNHDFNEKGKERMLAVPREGRDIIIRKGVWLASNVTIIGPCEIGENSVIGACSLVKGNIPANTLYAGVPAKYIKNIED